MSFDLKSKSMWIDRYLQLFESKLTKKKSTSDKIKCDIRRIKIDFPNKEIHWNFSKSILIIEIIPIVEIEIWVGYSRSAEK